MKAFDRRFARRWVTGVLAAWVGAMVGLVYFAWRWFVWNGEAF